MCHNTELFLKGDTACLHVPESSTPYCLFAPLNIDAAER